MSFITLTQPELIILDQPFSNRNEAIQYLAGKLDETGKLNNRQEFINAVMAREGEGALQRWVSVWQCLMARVMPLKRRHLQ